MNVKNSLVLTLCIGFFCSTGLNAEEMVQVNFSQPKRYEK